MLNEVSKTEVYEDIYAFIKNILGAGHETKQYVIALDAGTTSWAILFDKNRRFVAAESRNLNKSTPRQAMWSMMPKKFIAFKERRCWICSPTGIAPNQIAAIGITNQRETTVIWDRRSQNHLSCHQ